MPAAKPKVPRQCKQCGKITHVNPCHANRPFCNRDCMSAHYSEHPHAPKGRPGLRGPDSPRWKGGPIETVCANCGKPVFRKPDQFKRSENHFCNPQCLGEWVRKTGAKTGENASGWKGGSFDTQCANCGKPLKRCGYKMKRSERQFCSRKCHGEWDTQHNVGENATNWRGGVTTHNYGPRWPRQRLSTLERDGYTCQDCLTPQDQLSEPLHVHHIVPLLSFPPKSRRKAHALANLVSLCQACHLAYHRTLLPQVSSNE